jgi:aryl-alcohol dehydrogenase-like predicted oxidoreductase
MRYKQLGTTGLRVSALGFGCAALGSRTGSKVARATVAQAVDHGVNFFDTAPFYGQGESERILGSVFRGRRDQVIVATKVGLYPSLPLRLASKLKPLVRSVLKSLPGAGRASLQKSVQGFMRSQGKVQFDRDSLVKSLESSLRRLRTDYVDLLLLHVTPPREAIPDVVAQLQSLQQQGKIRHFAASSHDLEDMQLWLQPGIGIAALQIRLNLLEMAALDACLPVAAQQGVGVIAREPFAQGRLIPPRPATGSGQLGFLGSEYDSRFAEQAAALGRTVPQLAIQYLVQSEGIASVLTGMSTASHMRENVGVLDLPPLTDEAIAAIHKAGAAAG